MRRLILMSLVLSAAPLSAQSLNLQRGQHGIEATAGWSTSDSQNGYELFLAVGLGGVVDLGFGKARYDEVYDEPYSSYDELSPFARLFVMKQQDGNPISVALYAQVYLDDYDYGAEASYLQLGPTFYRAIEVTDAISITPFFGFAFMTENWEEDGDSERTNFLQRDFGVQLTTRADRPWGLAVTFIDQAYNTSTYRGARLLVMRRL